MMEEKKNVFTYIRQLFATYGIIVMIFVIFHILLGDFPEGYSTLFALGKEGITIPILCELFLLAGMITLAQVAFLTDRLIMNMTMLMRNVLFFVSVMIVMIVMIFSFKWFPTGDILAWTGFVVCYALSMLVSVLIVKLREKLENSKMQEALDKYNNR